MKIGRLFEKNGSSEPPEVVRPATLPPITQEELDLIKPITYQQLEEETKQINEEAEQLLFGLMAFLLRRSQRAWILNPPAAEELQDTVSMYSGERLTNAVAAAQQVVGNKDWWKCNILGYQPE